MKKLRQGDVFIEQINSVDLYNFEKKETKTNYVLAEGEVTGHKHQITCLNRDSYNVYVGASITYLEVLRSGVSIVHEEHKTIELEPAWYKIKIQQEYDPVNYRKNVMD